MIWCSLTRDNVYVQRGSLLLASDIYPTLTISTTLGENWFNKMLILSNGVSKKDDF